jgi:hypothetical protein
MSKYHKNCLIKRHLPKEIFKAHLTGKRSNLYTLVFNNSNEVLNIWVNDDEQFIILRLMKHVILDSSLIIGNNQ